MINKNIFAFIVVSTCVMCFSSNTLAVSFNTQDLAGNWFGHHIVTGDAPGDDPRWGYGTVTIDSSGNYSTSWTSPTQTNEVTSGTVQITSDGMITVDNQPLTHGTMNDNKDLFVFIDGTSQSGGHALTIMIKHSNSTSFNTSDLAGTWYGYHIVSGDAPADDPRWGYGTAAINTAGDYTASWTSPTQTNEVSSGTIQINSSGLINIDNLALTHGVMNDAKDLLVFIDGTTESQGNALTVMVKRHAATNFSLSDLSGTWLGHHVVSGDAPADDPRWGYGSAVINSSGDYTASWSSPTQTDEISAGTIQIDANGLIKIDNQALVHGAMNDAKDLLVFIDGTTESQGNALAIMFKRAPPPPTGPNLLLLQQY